MKFRLIVRSKLRIPSKRSLAYTTAIQAIEKAWEDSGASQVCKRCIAHGQGCCGGCPNLGPIGCIDKPLPCAVWTCEKIRRPYPRLAAQMDEIKKLLGMPSKFYRSYIMDNYNTPPVKHEFASLKKTSLIQISNILA